MKRLLIIVLIFFCSHIWATDCSVSRPDLSIYFGNGMFNDPEDANQSLRQLQRRMSGQLPGYRVRYKMSYNHNENPFDQVLEVARQKVLQDYSLILLWLSGIEQAPDWFQEALRDTVTLYNAFNYIFDGDLQRHVADYEKAINDCQKVLLVAHSQGNFYGNEAWREVYRRSLANLPLNQLKVMGMVSIATPASQLGSPLANVGDLPAITGYVTLDNDLVINIIRSYNFGPLPANLSNDNESEDWKNHSFVDTYLAGDPSGDIIKNQVRAVAYTLETLPFKRQSLDSSALASTGYDQTARILDVEFVSSGSVYRYYEIPGDVFRSLVSADSVGRYYNLFIRGQYPSRRLY